MSEVSQRLEPVSIYLCIFRKRQFLYCLVKVIKYSHRQELNLKNELAYREDLVHLVVLLVNECFLY